MTGKKKVEFYVTRFIGIAILLGIYLYGLRPVRRTITQQIVLPIVTPYFNNAGSPYVIENKGTALTLTFTLNDDTKTIRYQPQLGFFFLVALIGLIFITLKPRWYLYLLGFHIFFMILIIGIVFFSRQGWHPGFILVDFLDSYLIPGLSFAYVAMVYIINKNGGQFFKSQISSR